MIAGFHLQAQANAIQKGNVRFYFSFLKKLCIAFADREKRVFIPAKGVNDIDKTYLAVQAICPFPNQPPRKHAQLLARKRVFSHLLSCM